VEIGQTTAKIWRFVDVLEMAAAANLDFQNVKLLMVGRLKTVEVRRVAKFGGKRSNRGRDIAIFRFFAILKVKILKILTVGMLKRVKLRHGVKFRLNPSNHGQNMAIFPFFKMAAAAVLNF